MISAAEILQNDYQIDSEIWSVTSFNELRKTSYIDGINKIVKR